MRVRNVNVYILHTCGEIIFLTMQTFRSSMNIEMWPFQKHAVLDAPPEDSALPAVAVDRVEEARQVVRELKSRLDALDRRMLVFKSKYKIRTNKFGVLLSVESQGIGGYDAIALEWRVLLKERDGLLPEWHRALHRLASELDAVKEKTTA
jgi:hypothetical protein